jgi:hypothetical protein
LIANDSNKKTSHENREFQVASIGFSKKLRLAAFFRFVAALAQKSRGDALSIYFFENLIEMLLPLPKKRGTLVSHHRPNKISFFFFSRALSPLSPSRLSRFH